MQENKVTNVKPKQSFCKELIGINKANANQSLCKLAGLKKSQTKIVQEHELCFCFKKEKVFIKLGLCI